MHDLFSEAKPAVDWQHVRPVVDAALDELGERDREAVLMRFFEDRPFAEIGAALRITDDAARMRVDRALEKLQALLVRRGITSSSAALGVMLTGQAAGAIVPANVVVSVTSVALASAATAVVISPVGAILGFMSTSKVIVGVVIVLGLGGIGSALYQREEARRAETALAAYGSERADFRARLAHAEARARDAEELARANAERVAALDKQLDVAKTAVSGLRASASTPVASAIPVAPAANVGMEMLGDPDYVQRQVQRYRSLLRIRFGLLFRALQFSPEQIAKFETNRTQFQQATMEVWSAAVAQGVAVSDPAIVKMAKEAMGGLDEELRALLGEEGYRQYSRYAGAESATEMIGSLAGSVYYTDAPLSAEQGERLAKVIMDFTEKVPVAPGSKTIRYQTDWAAVESESRKVLAASQAEVFQALVEAKKLQEQMSAISRARASPGSAPKPQVTGAAKAGGGEL
jgi:hypothetical protein